MPADQNGVASAFVIAPELALSPLWPDGAACWLGRSGTTLALPLFQARLLDLLCRQPAASVDRMVESLFSGDCDPATLRAAIANSLAEFERLGVVTRTVA